MQAVIHVSDADRVDRALGNASSLLAPTNDVDDVVLVANGDAVTALGADGGLDSRIAHLHTKGLVVRACRNSLRRQNLTEDALVDGIDTVPSGVVHVVSLQTLGWSYLKP